MFVPVLNGICLIFLCILLLGFVIVFIIVFMYNYCIICENLPFIYGAIFGKVICKTTR